MDAIKLPNELDFEQWYCENAVNFERNPIGSRDCDLQRRAWHAALDALKAEGEPVFFIREDWLRQTQAHLRNHATATVHVFRDGKGMQPAIALYGSPLPPSTTPTDGEMLEFMIDQQAVIIPETFDDTFTRYSCIKIDQDENIVVLSGENKTFATPRTAILAAMAAEGKS
jgi:hypothetical protein